jgi:phospholipid/cholesterol/gamma-HCH transport system substrate-binding protein
LAQQRSIEIRSGIFVVVCLALMAGLILYFSKSGALGSDRYAITVVFPNASGIIKDANVLYAGVPIGNVTRIAISEEGNLSVKLTLAIYKQYHIRQDAKFVINQSGLLGDRYVDIIPQSTTAPMVKPGDLIEGSPSLDLTEAIRGVVDVLHQAAGTMERVDGMLRRVDALVLSTQNLTHVSESLANIDATTSNTATLTANLAGIIQTNRGKLDEVFAELSRSASDFGAASKHAEQIMNRLDDVVATNAPDVHGAITNLAASAERLNHVLTRVENGEGTAGKLLVDSKLHDDLVQLIDKINRYGLFYNTWIGPKPGNARRVDPASVPPAKRGQPPATNSVPARPTRPPAGSN